MMASVYKSFAEAFAATSLRNQYGEETSAEEEDAAWKAGESAYDSGKERSSNPYNKLKERTLHHLWDQGWDSTAEDRERGDDE